MSAGMAMLPIQENWGRLLLAHTDDAYAELRQCAGDELRLAMPWLAAHNMPARAGASPGYLPGN